MDKKKVIGAAAGAAAATAVGIAATKMAGRRPTVYHVRPDEEKWIVLKEGSKKASSRHDTKRQAVKEGRRLAGENPPSRLIIHRTDDSVQKEHSYTPEAGE